MNERTKNILIGVLIVGIVSMTIVYAALSQQLNINGSAKVAAGNWNIHFVRISNTANEVVTHEYAEVDDSIALSVNNTTATLPEVTFKAPGDSVDYYFNVVNEGEITGYVNVINDIQMGDATFSNNESLSQDNRNALKSAISATLLRKSGSSWVALNVNDSIAQNEVIELKVTITFAQSATESQLPSSEVSFSNITASLVFGQDTASQQGGGGGQAAAATPLEVGDTVNFSTQGFHVLSSDASETVLLADYNLDTSNLSAYNTESNSKVKRLSNKKVAVNINSIAQSNSTSENYVKFSPTNYWHDLTNDTLKSSFAKDLNENTASYDGDPYPYVYRSASEAHASSPATGTLVSDNDFIGYYVDGYVNSLKDQYNAPSNITGRLASYEEMYSLNNSSAVPSWAEGNYWLGSASDDGSVWNVLGGYLGNNSYLYGNNYGVRPVIVVSTSDIQ